MIFNKLFSEINYRDIEDLTSQKISENQNIEFKKEVWGRGDEDVREMLRDIDAIANGYGGYLIIGIEEDKDGFAGKIHNIDKAEEERDRIFSSCIANLQPRIPGLSIKCLAGDEGNIIIIHIPYSLRAPHIITFRGLNQFWIRHDRQKSPMSVDEIRDAFARNTSITTTAADFLAARKKDLSDNTDNKPMFVLGALPIGASGEFVDVSDEELRNKIKNPSYNRHSGWDLKFSYDNSHPSFNGLRIGGKNEDHKQIELFRNGYLEARFAIGDLMIREKVNVKDVEIPVIGGYPIIEYTYSFIDQVENVFNYLGLDTQVLIFCIFIDIKGFGLRKYRPNTYGFSDYLGIWDKDFLEIGLMNFDHIDKNKTTKAITDRIWQSFNYDNSDNFYKDGQFDTTLWK
ncbi:MAG: ATP-binding protein [Candidatus Moraniibacteriota bacterium]